ncbi:MAG: hypothetical protein LLG02_11525 [Pelosinus sp.]|nr:hypothetical protein [Pelosinus sp.]
MHPEMFLQECKQMRFKEPLDYFVSVNNSDGLIAKVIFQGNENEKGERAIDKISMSMEYIACIKNMVQALDPSIDTEQLVRDIGIIAVGSGAKPQKEGTVTRNGRKYHFINTNSSGWIFEVVGAN